MPAPILWHDLLTLLCTDFFSDTPFAVRAEADLSVWTRC
jgi:hypothetical protein